MPNRYLLSLPEGPGDVDLRKGQERAVQQEEGLAYATVGPR